MKTVITQERKNLLAKLHVVAKNMKMSNTQYTDFLFDNFQVLSSKYLEDYQIKKAIQLLEGSTNNESDRWRKSVMASIGFWLRTTNQTETLDKIKSIACRAAGFKDFNMIPDNRLRDIYYEFKRKGKTAVAVDNIVNEHITELQNLN